MEQNTPYRYEAKNDGSYNELAAYAINLVGNVALYPSLHTIIIDGKFADDVGKFIDDNSLDFLIAPIEVNEDNISDIFYSEAVDADTIRKGADILLGKSKKIIDVKDNIIAEITKERDEVKRGKEMYAQWYNEVVAQLNRAKSQIQSIAVLIDSIFPKG